ncbi:MAG: ATP-grasp domain-containing protein, partial [Desulfovibrionaceae bacterium]|nr:ATP-grasp domain-containing protein [Desulfovibrionaceae bacterium]
MRSKRLLIVGAGQEQVPLYRLALDMGLSVTGSDQNPGAPGFAFADRVLIASTRDPDATVRAALASHGERPISGVITIANDAPVTVAAAALALGLPGVSLHSARIAANKRLQYDLFRERGLNVPEGREVESPEDLDAFIGRSGLPVIVKPTDNRGARGVFRITRRSDAAALFARSRAMCDEGRVLAQKFVEGDQVSAEGLVLDGEALIAMFSGRNYEYLDRYAPHVIENGGWLPGRFSAGQAQAMRAAMQSAAEAMGIENGPIKADLVLSGGQVTILEVTARLGGGYAATDSIPIAARIDLARQAILQALGEPVRREDLLPTPGPPVALRFFFP